MPWQSYQNLQVPISNQQIIRPRLSLTADILSYRLCSRQYGFFGNDGFVPAHTVQIFFGNIIHQVLDRVHRHYSGLINNVPPRTFPTDNDIDNYFIEVENALRAHGVRAINSIVREKALRVIKAFNRIEGPDLYPRIFDTEYRLESDRSNYVLRGVVDVLADSNSALPGDREIWDYKGTDRPDSHDQRLRDYEWQMCVYAELYRVKTGVFPSRAILYFINELDADPPITSRPSRAVYEVNFTELRINQAIESFHQTALQIIRCKNNHSWPNPDPSPREETCTICDVRWGCPASAVRYNLRYPIL